MHNIDYVLVGEKVKKKRLEKGYTREKLAEKYFQDEINNI